MTPDLCSLDDPGTGLVVTTPSGPRRRQTPGEPPLPTPSQLDPADRHFLCSCSLGPNLNLKKHAQGRRSDSEEGTHRDQTGVGQMEESDGGLVVGLASENGGRAQHAHWADERLLPAAEQSTWLSTPLCRPLGGSLGSEQGEQAEPPPPTQQVSPGACRQGRTWSGPPAPAWG